MTDKASPTGTAAARYTLLATDRQHFIDRAHECASYTLPMLFQKDVTSAINMTIKDPAQSIGTRGVNSMAAKMVVSLLPTNTPFFKINLDDIGLPDDVDDELKDKVKKGAGKLERQTLKDIENSGDVTTFNETLKHLLVVGNALVYVGEKGTRLYNLNKYVAMRDPDGNVREGVICEEVIPDSLPPEFLATLSQMGAERKTGAATKTLKLYTHIKVTDDRITWHQEVDGKVVPGSESSVPPEGNPWLFLRFTRVDGESYGRAHVEMYLGDLTSLEVLTKAVNDAAAAAAKVIFLVKPNSTTSARVLADAPNLAVRSGDAADVTILRLDKSADMQIAKAMIEEITRRLAHAFMMRSEVMRDAERVTAEEVRIVARELDEANGGIYSILSQELQLPYVKRRIFLLRKRSAVGDLPAGMDIAIVTGFAALGRAGEGDKLLRWIEKVTMLLSNPELGKKINIDTVIERLAIADGVDLEGLLIDLTTQQENAEGAMGQDMMQQLAPELMKQVGPALAQQTQQQQPTEGAPNGP